MKLKGRTLDRNEVQARIIANIRPVNGCLEWTGHTDKDGYGLATFGNVTFRAHRLALAILLWPKALADSAFVCHTCDNPRCCSPIHLYVGNGKTNATDRTKRGRSAQNANPHYGADNGRAILPHLDIAEIRAAMIASGMSAPAAAVRLGVHHSTLSRHLTAHKIATPPNRGGSPDRAWSFK